MLDRVRNRVPGVPTGVIEAARSLQLMAELRSEGWHRSIKGVATDGSGRPVPWITYPALHWLTSVLRPHHIVFEFGSGGSTVFLAQRVSRVVSVEHDARWAEAVQAQLPANASLHRASTSGEETHAKPTDEYTKVLLRQREKFDLIVVDGRSRNACMRAAVDSVTPDGLILLDDAERTEYRMSHELLSGRGFGRLDFWGPKPGIGFMSMTSVFGRDFNGWLSGLEPPTVGNR